MNIEAYRAYCLQKKGVTESTPFPGLPDVLVFKVMGKMFTATNINSFTSISLKCHPDEVEELRETYDAVQIPGYMSPKHWNRIVMDNSIPDDQIYQWIDLSYELVVAKLSRKLKLELNTVGS